MNQSDFYSYSILSGVWNDLDYDVLKLVKEYLRVHLDRRLLHNDYDEFVERSKIYNPLYYYYNERISYDRIDILSKYSEHLDRNYIRYGFKTDYKVDIKIIDDCISTRFKYKYYIFGTDLALDLFNINYDAPEAGLRLIRKRFVKSRTDNMIDAVNSFSDRRIRDYIRTLQGIEEGLITDKYTTEEAYEIADNILISDLYYIGNDD